MERCISCGASLPAGASFCGKCGQTLQQENEQKTQLSDQPTLRLEQGLDGNAKTIRKGNKPSDAFLNTPARPLVPPQSNGPVTPPPLVAEEDEERRRRLVALDLPLPGIGMSQQPVNPIPTIQGTPLPGHVPTIQGTPRVNSAPNAPGRPQISGGASDASHAADAGNNAPLAHHKQHKPHTHRQEKKRHRHPSQRRVEARNTHGHAPSLLSGIVKPAIILLATGIVLAGVLVVLSLTVWTPSLSLGGSSSVAPGGTLTLHGSSFLPNSSVTLTRDSGIPFYFAQQAAPAQLAHGSGRTRASAGNMAQVLFSTRTSNVVSVRGDGTFSVTLQIDSSLVIGQHVIHATEAPTRRSVSRTFTVISPQLRITPTSAGTPTPTSTPTPITASTATVTITPASQQVNNTFTIGGVTGTPGGQQVQARMLSATTQTVSQTVNATGQGTTPGTPSTGTLSIYDNSNAPIIVTAGSVYPCNGPYCSSQAASLHVVVDQTLTIPADSTVRGIPAHVQEVGVIGNFNCGSNSCFGSYDPNSQLGMLNDSAFTGGVDPQPYTYVQQSDIDNAANGLISANQPNAQQVLQGQVQANERAIGTLQCTPNTSANQKVGDHATTVTVSVNFTCTGEVYDYNGALSLARHLLTNQAAGNPGSGYALTGQIIATLNNASLNGQTVTLTIVAKGVWVYQVSTAQRQAWASSITGQSLQTAQALLAGQQGVAQVTIQLAEANAQVLPTDAQKITVVVQSVQGL